MKLRLVGHHASPPDEVIHPWGSQEPSILGVSRVLHEFSRVCALAAEDRRVSVGFDTRWVLSDPSVRDVLSRRHPPVCKPRISWEHGGR